MSAQVDEFLKTCRFHYRTLTLVSVTALVFSIIPSEKQRLQDALAEAELVAQMDFAQLVGQAVMDDAEAGTYMRRIQSAMSSAELTYARAPFEVILTHGAQSPAPDTDMTLDRLHIHIFERHSLTLNLPQIDDAFLDEVRRQMAQVEHRAEGLWEAYCYSDGDGRGGVYLKWQGGVSMRLQIDHPVKIIRKNVEIDFADLISENPTTDQLIRLDRTSQMSLFPCLHRFWNEVRDLRPRAATSHLAVRMAVAAENVDVLGLSIPAYLAGLAVPLTTFVLILHLHLYTRRLLGLVEGPGSSKTQRCFPWLPLFQDWTSQMLTVFSYPFLPIAANVLIVHRSFHTSPWITVAFAVILTALLDFFSYPRLIGRLRRLSLSNPSQADGPGNV